MSLTSNDPLWRPSVERMQQAPCSAFIRDVQRSHPEITSFQSLRSWSVSKPTAFWESLWDFADVVGTRRGESLMQAENLERSRWFPDSTLNFTANLLRRRDDAVALIDIDANGNRRTVTYLELADQTARVAGFLSARDIGAGDVVAGVLANGIEAVVAALACAQLGATWTACSVDQGPAAILGRLQQVKPVALFVSTAESAGTRAWTDDRVHEICGALPTCGITVHCGRGDRPAEPGSVTFDAALECDPLAEYPEFGFNHPLYILYSSGTTGAPKCIVHGAGGTLLQHLKELRLHTGLRADDVLFFFTSCGWMMWNWMVSGLACGATLVLYSGSPIFPHPRRLFDICAQEKVRVLGVSPKYLHACQRAKVRFADSGELSHLDTVLSTGSVLPATLYDYVYEAIKPDVLLSSISGGTDIVSCFFLGSELLPVYRGELQTAGLGMDVAAFDEHGQSLTGQTGELVCRRSFVSKPLHFFGDDDGTRFHNAYFSSFDGVWTHGDLVEINTRGGAIIHGRSDATLNIGGVRLGTGEIYREVLTFDGIDDAVAVEQARGTDARMVLFLKMPDPEALTTQLIRDVRRKIREQLSDSHVPACVIAVEDLPVTYSGKTAELAVKAVVNGQPVSNLDALQNPRSIASIEAASEQYR